jgi:hypothetical protein
MPVPDFSPGEVLTAGAMDSIGMWKVYSASFAGVTSVILPDGTFNANYRNYRLIYNIAVNADSAFTLRLRKNGTDNIGFGYNTTMNGVLSTGGGSDNTLNSQQSWGFGEQDSSIGVYGVSFDLYQPQLVTQTTATGNIICVNTPASATIGRAGGWWNATADTYDSVSFYSNQANSMTGVVRVYGYRD